VNPAPARLEVRGLSKTYPGSARPAVDGVSFEIGEGETLGLVGESGCGKTTTGRALLRLSEPDAGSISYRRASSSEPVDLRALPQRELRPLRRELQIVFQDPLASLDPRRTAGEAVAEGIRLHGLESGSAVRDRVADLLAVVGVGGELHDRYPHELSGGERQRVAIARALAVRPRFVVLDEPVTALDVSVQVQVLNLLLDLQEELGLSYLFIAHDLAVVRYVAHRVAVMKEGRIVETGDVEDVLGRPSHPHTRALVAAMPRLPARRSGDA
jgi:ABC-type oligopeptide transport system ATPase subunit